MTENEYDFLNSPECAELGQEVAERMHRLIMPIARVIEHGIARELGVDVDTLTFPQERLGRNGRVIMFPKTQTMTERHSGAVDDSAAYVSHGVIDPRAGLIGNAARAICSDEVGQLKLVIDGEINFFGPRPQTVQSLNARKAADPEFYKGTFDPYRNSVPEGLWSAGAVYGHTVYRPQPKHLAKEMRIDERWGRELTLKTAKIQVMRMPLDIIIAGFKISGSALHYKAAELRGQLSRK